VKNGRGTYVDRENDSQRQTDDQRTPKVPFPIAQCRRFQVEYHAHSDMQHKAGGSNEIILAHLRSSLLPPCLGG
jgi:hypothetical protein